MRKDRLWKIEVTISTIDAGLFDFELGKIPHGMIKLSEKHTLFNIYCENQSQTNAVKDMIKRYSGKYFIAENKALL